MQNFIKDAFERFFEIGDYSRERTLGAARSPLWSNIRAQFVRLHPDCAVCGTTEDVEVHHRLPFHLNPALELDPQNLISLCREHHFLFGHLLDWKAYNGYVSDDARVWRAKIATRSYDTL